MNLDVYPIKRVEGDNLILSFWSDNSRGTNPVLKIVSYSAIVRNGELYYNLAFGDYDERYGQVYDFVITNNGDMRKVLKTVISTLPLFFEEFPHERIHIDGSDQVRRAYYQKIIRDYNGLISQYFNVEGSIRKITESFQSEKEYDFIIVSRK
jgi:hypothetical protein